MLDAIKKAKLSTNATTLGIIIAGLFYLGFAFNKDVSSALVQAPIVVGLMTFAIKIVHQGDATEAQAIQAATQATEAKQSADAAAAEAAGAAKQSRTNNSDIAVMGDKVDGAVVKVDLTHEAVNGEMSKFRKDLIELTDMKVELATLIAEARGVKQGREDLIADTSAMAVATAHDPSADPPSSSEAVVVTAPATIDVKAPPTDAL
jgi:hypothetical protein